MGWPHADAWWHMSGETNKTLQWIQTPVVRIFMEHIMSHDDRLVSKIAQPVHANETNLGCILRDEDCERCLSPHFFCYSGCSLLARFSGVYFIWAWGNYEVERTQKGDTNKEKHIVTKKLRDSQWGGVQFGMALKEDAAFGFRVGGGNGRENHSLSLCCTGVGGWTRWERGRSVQGWILKDMKHFKCVCEWACASVREMRQRQIKRKMHECILSCLLVRDASSWDAVFIFVRVTRGRKTLYARHIHYGQKYVIE